MALYFLQIFEHMNYEVLFIGRHNKRKHGWCFRNLGGILLEKGVPEIDILIS